MSENNEVTIARMQKDIERLGDNYELIVKRFDEWDKTWKEINATILSLVTLQRQVNELEKAHKEEVEQVKADIQYLKDMKNRALGAFVTLSILSPIVGSLITLIFSKYLPK